MLDIDKLFDEVEDEENYDGKPFIDFLYDCKFITKKDHDCALKTGLDGCSNLVYKDEGYNYALFAVDIDDNLTKDKINIFINNAKKVYKDMLWEALDRGYDDDNKSFFLKFIDIDFEYAETKRYEDEYDEKERDGIIVKIKYSLNIDLSRISNLNVSISQCKYAVENRKKLIELFLNYIDEFECGEFKDCFEVNLEERHRDDPECYPLFRGIERDLETLISWNF